MALTIEVDGTEYTQYLSLSVTKQLDALSNSFNIEVTTTNGQPLPFQGNEECVIYADGEKQLTGWLEDVDGSYDPKSHSLTFNGRDKTCDIVDSSLAAESDIGESPTLVQLIQVVLDQLGLSLKIDELTGTEPFNKAEDNIAIENGDNAFEFLQSLSNKRQVLLSSDGEANVVVTQAQAAFSGGRILNVLPSNSKSSQNNVLTSSWNYTTSERFHTYKVSSKLNPISLIFGGEADLDSVVNQSGGATDEQVRPSRQMVFKAEKSSSNEQTLERAKWEANIRKTRAITYNCEVKGHTLADTSFVLWDINTLVDIVDVFAGIDDRMLVNKVTFKTDLTGGNTTELELVDKNAYTTIVQEPVNDTSEKGSGVFDAIFKGET